MNIKKRFLVITWVLSSIAFVGFATYGVIIFFEGYTDYWQFYIAAFVSFIAIWLFYWILFWSIRGFKKIGKETILQIIKWAVIIFLASLLFHLADYVIYKATRPPEKSGRQSKRIDTNPFSGM